MAGFLQQMTLTHLTKGGGDVAEEFRMRLADFILSNMGSILAKWDAFAQSVSPTEKTKPSVLRDQAEELLQAIIRSMEAGEPGADQSHDEGEGSESSGIVGVSDTHAQGRARWGFDLAGLVAEYQALRTNVIRSWQESRPTSDLHDLADLTRFNESLDESLAESVRRYTAIVDGSRRMFLAILGHDLRNPLTSVIMSAEMLSEGTTAEDQFEPLVKVIASSAQAMLRMIGDLLDFTQTCVDSAMPLATAPVNLTELCQEIVEEMRVAHPEREVRFTREAELAGVWDADRLRQMVSNLLGNAIKHGGKPTPIDVELHDEGGNVLLQIRNHGEPIPADILPRIFDPFVSGTFSTTHEAWRSGSIGLGLYIAREVAAAHGGTIDVTSTAEAGTVFSVKLPRHVGSANVERVPTSLAGV